MYGKLRQIGRDLQMNNTTKLERPVMKGGIMRDEMGNPPGTIYFLENPIEWIKSKFFGKKPESIPEPFPEVVKYKTFEELIAEKLDQIFNCNHICTFRPLEHYDRRHDFVVHKKFRYNRHKNFYSIEIYDAIEPELREVVYFCRFDDLYLMYATSPNHHLYCLTSKYTPGIWDELFLETLDELVDIKIAERKDLEEKKKKEIEQEELNKKIAEEVKQERIRKMFTEETV